jgi:DNA-binding response OmpR family regulator
MVLEAVRGEQGGRDPGTAGSVILVDDDPAAVEMYRFGLEASGFAVRIECSAAGLFEALEEEVPDILVLDWQLPGLRGDEILQRIRLEERTRSLPVFMLSNFPAGSADADAAIDRVFLAGALAWLQKVDTPPPTLAGKLTEALKKR